MQKNKVINISIGVILLIFFLFVLTLQIYFKDNTVTVSGTIDSVKSNMGLIEKVYLDWWDTSLKKISSQGVKDVYELKNTYENLNIVIRDSNVLKEVILNEIIVDGKPLSEYDYEYVESKDGKSVYKIPINQFDANSNATNKITKLITIYNRYDNVTYNIEIDSFEFRFNFSKDSDFLYLNFENYISNFYDKEFKVQTNYYDDSGEGFIYSFGHQNKSIKVPIVNKIDTPVSKQNSDLFFLENTGLTIYNRFSVPIMTIYLSSSGDLKIKNTYSLSNVYENELKNQVFVFDSNEDNIFKIEKNKNNSVDIINLIDNYKVYFDENTMKTYRLYEENVDPNKDKNLINFKMYRDLRDGNYVFTPNKAFDLYRFYDPNKEKFLSYNPQINKFILKDNASKFIKTNDNKLFDLNSRFFIKKVKDKDKNYTYLGESDFLKADTFKFNNMASTIFKKVNYDEIQDEIISSNYIQVMLKNKETGEFLSVNSNTKEALNSNLYNDSYLDSSFNYDKGTKDLNNFIFEIRPNNDEFTTFNLYSKVMGTSINTDYGFLDNKLVFDMNKDNKVQFVIEKNDGQDNEFKIKDDYGSYLSFQASDDFARVASSGFMKKFFNVKDDFDVFEIYMIDFNQIENINSGNFISFSSKSSDEKTYLEKTSADEKFVDGKSLDEYIVIKGRELLFLNGDNLLNDMVATNDFSNIKGINTPLISNREHQYLGYRFKILNDINNLQ